MAGWAFDWAPLADVATRSAQDDAALLLFAFGTLALLFAVLRIVGRLLERRQLRRSIAEAHRANGRGRETA